MATGGRDSTLGCSGDEGEDDLCEYEKKRMENIKMNQDMMKALGLPTQGKGKKGARTKKGIEKQTTRCGSRRSKRTTSKKRRGQWVESGSDSDSEWEPWMELQPTTKSTKTKLPDLTWEERLELLQEADRQVEEQLDEVLHSDNRKLKKGHKQGRNKAVTISQHPQSNLTEIFHEPEEMSEFIGFTLSEVERDEMCPSHIERGCVDEETSEPTDIHGNLLFPDTSEDEDFPGFTMEDVVLTEVPGYRTRRMTGLQTAATYEEDELSDEDEYLFCDDCNLLYHGDCMVHGPLNELESTSGYDRASLTYTQLPVPAQLSIKPSSIPAAGLGVFSTTTISKGVRLGPYEGKKINRKDMGDLFDTAYAWEIRQDGIEPYFIDGSDPACSNWMRFVNCARHEEEQNLLAYQYHGNIYYRTFKTINPDTELLVWYGDKYASELGIISHSKDFKQIARHNFKNYVRNRYSNDLKHRWNNFIYQNNNKNDLQQHCTTHGGENPYQCDYCEYRCSHKGNLQRHIRTHTGQKPYQCDYCEYMCSQKIDIQRHIRTHTGEKPYQCNYCEYRCSHKGNLQIHIRTHTGEKPYQCDYCEYRCSHKGSLQIHIRTHTGEKPYQCDYCEYRCSQKGSLQQHIRIHSGEKPYQCDYCEYRCSQKGSLQQHIRTHHT